MKKLYLTILLFSVLIINLTCTKDENTDTDTLELTQNLPASTDVDDYVQTNEGSRDGIGDLIFYRTSLTSDNYLLLSTSQSRLRIHKIFNKSMVKEIKFSSTGKSDVRIGSVLMSHYKVEIFYNDNSTEYFTAFSKKSLPTFTFKPTGENMLSTTNNSKFISYETSGISSTNPNLLYYNPWRDESYPLFKWIIKKDNRVVSVREVEPINKNSKQFMVIHVD